MPVVTQEKYDIAVKTDTIVRSYGVPRDVLLELGRMYFEAGQRDGLTAFAKDAMKAV